MKTAAGGAILRWKLCVCAWPWGTLFGGLGGRQGLAFGRQRFRRCARILLAGFQQFYSLKQFRQAPDVSELLLGFPDWQGRTAEYSRSGWDILAHSTLGAHGCPVSHLDVADQPNLPRQSHVIS